MFFFAPLRAHPRAASGESGPEDRPGDREDAQGRGGALLALGCLAALSVLLYLKLTALGDLREHLAVFLGIYAVLFLAFVASLPIWWSQNRARVLVFGLLAAGAMRLAMVPAAPSLSEDLHRYLWEGRVVRSGLNPMLNPPSAARLDHLRDENWHHVGHKEIASVYPPLALASFALAGWNVTAWKLFLVAGELAVVLLLMALLRERELPMGRAMVYGWCPLAVIEVAGQGHLEPIAIVPGLAALLLLLQRQRALSGVWLALAACGRLLHIAFAPALGRRLRFAGLSALTLTLVVLWFPFGDAAGASGYEQYGRRWEFNSVVFPGIQWTVAAIEPTPILKDGITFVRESVVDHPFLHRLYYFTDVPTLSRGVTGLGFLGWVLFLGARNLPPLRAAYLCVAGFVVLSPTLHPWYVLQLVPFLAFFPNLGWLLFTGTVGLSYAAATTLPDWDVPHWAMALEYLPVAGLLVVAPFWRMRR